MIKNFCPTHCLYYTGNECPMCAQERIASLEKRFVKTEKKVSKKIVSVEKEITVDALDALKAKFNTKHV